MKFLKSHYLFTPILESESQSIKYSPKDLVFEICVSMVLLNNDFLDNILDRGLKARYSENSSVFMTDLKNLLLSKNRLSLGKVDNNKFIEDTEISKINGIFDSNFDIEKDWNMLVKSRNTARSIIDKLIPNEKLDSTRISKVFWIGPNKNDNYGEDIVIETTEGNQYSLFLNKNLSTSKSSSFNTFIDDLIGEDVNRIFDEENLPKWDKLTSEWIKITYENSNKNIQSHIEKFIDTKRIDSIGYFEYFDIRHRDPRYRHLGEFINEFDKNILKLSDLMNEIWKKEESFTDFNKVSQNWKDVKTVVLNSRILEYILTTSLKKNNPNEISKLENGFKKCDGSVKMKFMKTIVNKLGSLERDVFFVSKEGNSFYRIPSRSFFRDNYDVLDINFDYHVKFTRPKDDDFGYFKIKSKLILRGEEILNIDINVDFSGGEFTNKLSAKYKFEIPQNFNYLISKSVEEES
jgi:hypothetical protein